LTTPEDGQESGEPEHAPAIDQPTEPAGSRSRPIGASTFTIEGRSAPALFVIGWMASLLGAGLLVLAVVSGGGAASLGLIVVGLLLLSIGLVAGAGSQGIERRSRGAPAYSGPSPLLVFAASIPISILALIIASLPLSFADVALDGPLGALFSVLIQALIYIALIRLLVVDVGALDWRAMGVLSLDRSALGEMIRGAAWALPVIAATLPLSLVLLAIFPVAPESPLPPTGELLGFTISLLAGALVAPFGEEILFRAFATTAWVRGLGARRGVVRAALLFAFAHVLTTTGTSAGDALGLAVVGFGTRIPIALGLGWLFVRRGTVWASFGLHAAFNALLLVIAELANRPI